MQCMEVRKEDPWNWSYSQSWATARKHMWVLCKTGCWPISPAPMCIFKKQCHLNSFSPGRKWASISGSSKAHGCNLFLSEAARAETPDVHPSFSCLDDQVKSWCFEWKHPIPPQWHSSASLHRKGPKVSKDPTPAMSFDYLQQTHGVYCGYLTPGQCFTIMS